MKIAERLDAGDILAQRATPIVPADTAATLHERLARIGAELLVETLDNCINNKITACPQVEAEATFARKITKADGRLDWSQPARSLWNRVRAFTPWPGAFTSWPGGAQPRTLKIWRASVEQAPPAAPGEVLQADKAGILWLAAAARCAFTNCNSKADFPYPPPNSSLDTRCIPVIG